MSVLAVPEDWIQTTLDEVSIYIQRGKGPKYSTEPNDFPVVNQKAIRWFGIEKEHLKYVDQAQWGSWDQERFIQENDILWNSTGTGTVGRACFVDSHELPKAKVVDSHVTIVRASKKVSGKYIFYWVMHPEVQSKVGGLYTGTTNQVELTKKMVQELEIPLPPLAEQKVIVNKLDTLLAQLESIKARLERILEILKQFHQSVLAAAVSGRLTEEWRITEGVAIETWKYEAAKNVCEKVQSGSTPRENPFDQDGTIPFLKVYNIVDQKIDFDYKPQFITSETHSGGSSARSVAFPNDVLMNIVGPPLGKVAILTNQFPEWNLNQAITLFRVNKELLDHEYLYYVLCEGTLVRDVMPETKGSVGQVNISLSQCREAILPVPSIEEQREVVRCIGELFSKADAVNTYVRSALDRVNNLTQSILAKAFRGELTTDWREANPELISGENSAKALLERIKAERTVAKPTTKRGRGKV